MLLRKRTVLVTNGLVSGMTSRRLLENVYPRNFNENRLLDCLRPLRERLLRILSGCVIREERSPDAWIENEWQLIPLCENMRDLYLARLKKILSVIRWSLQGNTNYREDFVWWIRVRFWFGNDELMKSAIRRATEECYPCATEPSLDGRYVGSENVTWGGPTHYTRRNPRCRFGEYLASDRADGRYVKRLWSTITYQRIYLSEKTATHIWCKTFCSDQRESTIAILCRITGEKCCRV